MAFVLIVDGDKTLAERASDVLIGAGHACGWVVSPEQAWALLRWRQPDLILLDQTIPGADGGALPRTLLRAAGATDLPIILMTTAAPAEPGDSAIVDNIRKSFDPRYLVWRVNHALEARAARPLFFDAGESSDPPFADAKGPDSLRTLA